MNKINGFMNTPNIQYYVALDLGSESMAACYIGDSPDPRMIDLQQFGKAYIEKKNEDGLDDRIDYRKTLLYDTEEDRQRGRHSSRMKTRIVLRSPNPYAQLTDDHANIEFVDDRGGITDDYRRSIFNFFPGPHEQLNYQLPNPKIPFQAGADYILPTVLYEEDGHGPEEVRYAPEALVQNLLNQIIRNFILKSKELRNVRPENIHLAVTVPNVYSLTHIKSIENFIKQHGGLLPENVVMIYESDAVCHYHHLFDVILRKIKTDVIGIQQAEKHRDELRYHFVTVDVGSGTTDMSLITVRQPFDRNGDHRARLKGRTSHLVSARVGRSDGGNKLSYLLAEFYERQLQAVLSDFAPKSPEIRTEFSFTKSLGRHAEQHTTAVGILSGIIFKIKSTMSESYQVGIPYRAQIAMLTPLIEAVFECLFLDWKHRTDLRDDFNDLSHKLLRAMVLPRELTPGTLGGFRFYRGVAKELKSSLWLKVPDDSSTDPDSDLAYSQNDDIEDYSRLPEDVLVTPGGASLSTQTLPGSPHVARTEVEAVLDSGNGTDLTASSSRTSGPAYSGTEVANLDLLDLWREYKVVSQHWRALKRSLEQYVKLNVSDLLTDLGNMAIRREGIAEGQISTDKIVNHHFTFVMVAGQGSQFRPIMRAIESCSFAGNGNVVSLPAAELKNACCKGAVQLTANGIHIENPFELHGRYYLYQKLVTINTQDVPLRLNHKTTLSPYMPGLKWLVFSPSSHIPELSDEGVENGRLAFISQLGDEEAYRFYYDTRQQVIRINDVVVDKLATFGHIDEAIWPKVWPIVLPNKKSKA
ncbi:hypothetical protein MJD09_23820 [bacterium]|nr:hypothetical protein [bacterium]